MPKTKQKLAEEVLLELGRADAANPAESAEDIDLVKRRYEGVLGELEDSDLVFWDEDAIPTRVFAPLAKLIATECAQAFGTGAGDTDDLKDHGVVTAYVGAAADA